jgi:hypothetical protein
LTVALANNHGNLSLACLIARQPAIDTVLRMIGGLAISAEIAAINLPNLAVAANYPAFQFLRHRLP